MAPHTIPWGSFNLRSTNKIKFFDKILTSEKNINLLKDLKYEHQSTFPLWGRVKLILGTGRENKIFFLKIPANVNFFHQTVKK